MKIVFLSKYIEKEGKGIYYCRKCGNTDPTLFSTKKGKLYCRACISFNGKKARIAKKITPKTVTAKLAYSLSKRQKEVSEKALRESKEIYINAVCGAGKTEIVFESIEQALLNGERVGFVIPRREVVKEIFERLKEVYPTLNIIAVYGGHNEYLDGDIVVLTAHQTYRYPKKFGLVILDEYDAFPLKNDRTLNTLVKNSCYNKMIYLSATFTKEELFNKNQVSLTRRYHEYDLIVPRIIVGNTLNLLHNLVRFIKKNKDVPKFVFVPTISMGIWLRRYLSLLGMKPLLFTSVSDNKEQILKLIKEGNRRLVIATTILERGITVKQLQVLIFYASHVLFDYKTLVQIAGRAGRKIDAPLGQVIYLSTSVSEGMIQSVNEIVDKNNGIKYSQQN